MAHEVPRLLLVDDNEDNRFTLSLLLEVEGFTDLTVAEDGEQALERLDTDSFDLVFLDLMMPRLNGYQVLERLKARGRLGDPPVIMITALDEIDSAARCIELGAEDYLPKPFNPVLLKARIRATLEKKRLRDEIRHHRDRMELELQEARALQLGLCPTDFPPPSGKRPFDIAAVMEPAREVGGDLYDVFERRDGSLCFLVGDVSGKGAPAALFMARSKDIVRLVADGSDGAGELPGPGEILVRANEMLCTANQACMFVTMFVGVLDPEGNGLRYANAGHNDPYHLSADGRISAIAGAGKGRPLGIRAGSRYGTGRLKLEPGEALFAFTDGVTEAADGDDQLYAETRLEEALRRNGAATAAGILDSVMEDLRRFTAGAPQSDDITALAIRRVGAPG